MDFEKSLKYLYLRLHTVWIFSITQSQNVNCSNKATTLVYISLITFEALTRTEIYLANIIENRKSRDDSTVVAIPSDRQWIINMWHFGVDTLDEYTGKEFHVTFEEGMSDMYRIYTKRMRDGRHVIRAEHQEYPNQEYADALV